MPWSALAGASPYALFLALCAGIVVSFARDWVISAKRYDRREREWEQRYERDIASERRIADYQEKRAVQEGTRADRATEALTALSAQMPEALEALRQAKAGQP